METAEQPGAAVETVTELTRRFGGGSGAPATELLHPDVTVEQPGSLPHGGVYRGVAGLGDMAAAFGKNWERVIENPRIFGSGGSAVMLTTQTWTAVTSGRSATVDVVELFTVVDGLVRSIRVFPQDTHLLLQTLDAT